MGEADGPSPASDRSEALDKGLELAFRRGGTATDSSVLAALQAAGESAARVLLREPVAKDPPVVRPNGVGTEGRHQILGEIARGGVGIILEVTRGE